MRDVYEYAKYFIKNGVDSCPNTFDGNMRLQKLLFFADLANLAEYGELLFAEPVLAFRNGCVVEKVWLRYRNDYDGFKRDSEAFSPDFSEREYDILNFVLKVFGNTSARELSDINHTFEFWKKAYAAGTEKDGYHNKDRSAVNMAEYESDIERMRDVISLYRRSSTDSMSREVINGVTFFYDGFELTDEMIEVLDGYSMTAEDEAYTVYLDGGEMVIY